VLVELTVIDSAPGSVVVEFHLIPSLFSDNGPRLLRALGAPEGTMRMIEVDSDQGRLGGDVVLSGLLGLEDVAPGESRYLEGTVKMVGSRPLGARVETFGAFPPGRLLVGLAVDFVEGVGGTLVDLHLGLMALSCAALGGDDQGFVLMGVGLGPVGAGIGRGTVAEQARALLDVLEESIDVVVAAPATARALGVLEGFECRPMGDLTEWRRA
jgi:hypothetical protein